MSSIIVQNILQRLSQLKAEVRLKYKAELKGLFGSYVKGTQHKNSDVDILVDFLSGADLFDFIALYCISFETYTFMMTIRSPQSFAGCPQMIADSYAKSVVFI